MSNLKHQNCSQSQIGYKYQFNKRKQSFQQHQLIKKEQEQFEHKERILKKKKTQLCRNFIQNAYCRFGQFCRYAHNTEELIIQNGWYKTKKCQSYFTKMICPYGKRCNYLHQQSKEQKNKIRQNWRKKILKNYPQLIIQKKYLGQNSSKLLKILQL